MGEKCPKCGGYVGTLGCYTCSPNSGEAIQKVVTAHMKSIFESLDSHKSINAAIDQAALLKLQQVSCPVCEVFTIPDGDYCPSCLGQKQLAPATGLAGKKKKAEPKPQPCSECGQFMDLHTTGGYHCPKCGMPTLHDDPMNNYQAQIEAIIKNQAPIWQETGYSPAVQVAANIIDEMGYVKTESAVENVAEHLEAWKAEFAATWTDALQMELLTATVAALKQSLQEEVEARLAAESKHELLLAEHQCLKKFSSELQQVLHPPNNPLGSALNQGFGGPLNWSSQHWFTQAQSLQFGKYVPQVHYFTCKVCGMPLELNTWGGAKDCVQCGPGAGINLTAGNSLPSKPDPG